MVMRLPDASPLPRLPWCLAGGRRATVQTAACSRYATYPRDPACQITGAHPLVNHRGPRLLRPSFRTPRLRPTVVGGVTPFLGDPCDFSKKIVSGYIFIKYLPNLPAGAATAAFLAACCWDCSSRITGRFVAVPEPCPPSRSPLRARCSPSRPPIPIFCACRCCARARQCRRRRPSEPSLLPCPCPCPNTIAYWSSLAGSGSISPARGNAGPESAKQ